MLAAKSAEKHLERDEHAREWLASEVPSPKGQRPIDLILDGKAEVLTGMLYARNAGMPL